MTAKKYPHWFRWDGKKTPPKEAAKRAKAKKAAPKAKKKAKRAGPRRGVLTAAEYRAMFREQRRVDAIETGGDPERFTGEDPQARWARDRDEDARRKRVPKSRKGWSYSPDGAGWYRDDDPNFDGD